ncbi:hypothetical protein E4K67_04260 [Desulfosporosinus fructosivorans]|uniref:Uncharacterized protein n=1 Tax=Desulfosporosinus fructosivorans TaxID=2018669 RepID=A0A4Z0R8F0_9FIRM|nr:hypothetical protein [Desulfosporosinus fructosivorans]TGE38705.1 hypothetical protein E4K67_04260 [Desulfosporosinus fructosivorans]
MFEGFELEIIEHEKEKIFPWIEEFYKAVGNSMFLVNQLNDTSLRQAYILLDNAVELFLVNFLKAKKTNSKSDYRYFEVIINETKEILVNSIDILDRISQYHNTRNILYHKSVFITISKSRFKEYLDDVIEICDLMKLDNSSEIINRAFFDAYHNVFSSHFDERSKALNIIEDTIKNNFGIIPGEYHGDIILASPCGSSFPALENFEIILLGVLKKENVNRKKARVLELIEANEENASHSFLISRTDSYTWFSFIDCFWSKWGEGERSDIINIRKMINKYESQVIYKRDYIKKEMLLNAFDPMYTGQNSCNREKDKYITNW